jgi:tetratricopeptide (TPR) repeat protein
MEGNMTQLTPQQQANAKQWLPVLRKHLQNTVQTPANWLRLCLIAAAIAQVVGLDALSANLPAQAMALVSLLAGSPILARLVNLLGGNLLASLLEQTANPDEKFEQLLASLATPEQIETIFEKTLQEAGLLTERQFYHAFAPLLRENRQDHAEIIQLLQEILAQQPTVPSISLPTALARLQDLPTEQIPPVSSLPSQSRITIAANEHFVGREAELRTLAKLLKEGQNAVIVPAVLSGSGGIGKTQLAAEFAHRYGTYFAGGVYWVSAESEPALLNDLADCGGAVTSMTRLAFDALPQPDRLQAVKNALQSELPRLLVLDNADHLRLPSLQAHLPRTGGCRVLLTSRNEVWGGSHFCPIALDTLARPASVQLLQTLCSRLTAAEADAIADELDDFPLALHLAGSYLANNPLAGVPRFLQRLQSEKLHLLTVAGKATPLSPTDHSRDVRATFALSWEQLNARQPTDAMALLWLARCTCCAPGETIPAQLLHVMRAEAQEDEDAFDSAILRLRQVGLLTADAQGVRLHRLLGDFVQEMQTADIYAQAQPVVESAASSLADAQNEAGYPAAGRSWRGQLLYLCQQAATRTDERAARLLHNAGFALNMDGDYASALPLYQQALAISEQVLGAEHPHTATSLNNLAALYRAMGDTARAVPLSQRALAIREQVLGAEHPSTATSLNNLAALYDSMGDYARALPLYQRALAITEQVLGAEHPSTATSLNNLAGLYYNMGDSARALPLYQRALAIREQVLGAEHPDTAQGLNNLAGLYYNMGDYPRALPLYQRALAIWEQVLGAEHPDTATSLNNLAALYRAMGDYTRALPLYQRALAIMEKTLGENHPNTKIVRRGLAGLLQKMKTGE